MLKNTKNIRTKYEEIQRKLFYMIPRHAGKTRLLLKTQLEALGINIETLMDLYEEEDIQEER